MEPDHRQGGALGLPKAGGGAPPPPPKARTSRIHRREVSFMRKQEETLAVRDYMEEDEED